MDKYYTRAGNFYYGQNSVEKIKKKTALPLSGNKFISFDSLEIINKKGSKIYHIKANFQEWKTKTLKTIQLTTMKIL